MKNIFKNILKLYLFFGLLTASTIIEPNLTRCVDTLKQLGADVSNYLGEYYDTNRIYTGAIGLVCLANSVCSATDITTLAAAGVAVAIAATYDPSAKQHCIFIPEKYNWLADTAVSIMPEASITGTPEEALVRSGINTISTAASVISAIPDNISLEYPIDYDDIGYES